MIAMQVRSGARLKSRVCTTEVVVVRAPSSEVDLRCGGQSMLPPGETGEEVTSGVPDGPGTLLGKRYTDDESGLELLCVKAGPGTLSIGQRPLGFKVPKPLPASD